MRNERGYVEEIGAVIIFLVVATVVLMGFFSKWEVSEDNVSGIVYNTTNNGWPAGNTKFSIRASENTYVSEENKSSYCLPPDSQYKELVNRAAGDKRVKVQVTTKKGFWLRAPWTCVPNVTVREVK